MTGSTGDLAGTRSLPGHPETTDADLVLAFVNQKQDSAFIELIQRHQISVFRKLSVELADPDDAEAVCEAVFVVASQRLSEWSREGDFRDWLFGVMREVAAARPGAAADMGAPRFVDPSIFFKHSVHRALHTLTEEQRDVLLAVDLEGKPVEHVATARTASVERVTQALEEARSRFTDALSQPDTRRSAERPPARLHPGEVIDKRYLVEELLGEGGMAAVFRAEHLVIKRKVAVKTLLPTRQAQAMLRERFVREAEVLGRLSHPNFVDISDFGESGRGMAYLVMELLEGRSLAAELREAGRLHPARALRLLREVASGLAFAHGLGIIHRDIKPDNIVVLHDDTREGFAKILDLGIAATEGEEPETTLYGTPAYMAPEQILGARIDGRVDVYAAGVMLFELLTGEVPFEGSTSQFVLAQHMTSPVPRLADFAPGLPESEALQDLIDRCMAKSPEARMKSARHLKDELDALLPRFDESTSKAPPRAPEPVASGAAPARPVARRRSGLWWLLFVLAVLAAGAVAYWYSR